MKDKILNIYLDERKYKVVYKYIYIIFCYNLKGNVC